MNSFKEIEEGVEEILNHAALDQNLQVRVDHDQVIHLDSSACFNVASDLKGLDELDYSLMFCEQCFDPKNEDPLINAIVVQSVFNMVKHDSFADERLGERLSAFITKQYERFLSPIPGEQNNNLRNELHRALRDKMVKNSTLVEFGDSDRKRIDEFLAFEEAFSLDVLKETEEPRLLELLQYNFTSFKNTVLKTKILRQDVHTALREAVQEAVYEDGLLLKCLPESSDIPQEGLSLKEWVSLVVAKEVEYFTSLILETVNEKATELLPKHQASTLETFAVRSSIGRFIRYNYYNTYEDLLLRELVVKTSGRFSIAVGPPSVIKRLHEKVKEKMKGRLRKDSYLDKSGPMDAQAAEILLSLAASSPTITLKELAQSSKALI